MLSRLLEQCALSFDPKSSHYKIERSKESTARITIWREYGVVRSYTMESTYCGFDQGSFKVSRETGGCGFEPRSGKKRVSGYPEL
ncbi:cytosolic carboxypeptidase 1-like [Diaphorina citri]|uniref:Cytosolic carboxypeptidase 1-like n=1 Tax=Diaphorina citri TaxID=121845 RepID=A0A1S3CWU4_DIACI|nr:cytosolic carboxypeptidase 1-like [Diaphorina citri]